MNDAQEGGGGSEMPAASNFPTNQQNVTPGNISTPNLTVGTLNVNSLFKLKNLSNAHLNTAFSFKRADKKLQINPKILGGN